MATSKHIHELDWPRPSLGITPIKYVWKGVMFTGPSNYNWQKLRHLVRKQEQTFLCGGVQSWKRYTYPKRSACAIALKSDSPKYLLNGVESNSKSHISDFYLGHKYYCKSLFMIPQEVFGPKQKMNNLRHGKMFYPGRKSKKTWCQTAVHNRIKRFLFN